ncbi:phosphotriesterase family protein [Herbiconiux ginsengi]|uniref:Phosphotriesterase-related protein n=1 Tax=Herbiconiux ginsengi TaxID=381665 RepID=A0A1H3SXF5_9MICO|nr:phosphotriesterase [Herbiconiux ginsengi]SDZ42185.1 phosphotriesterase-related protein [Herbiconiux ginsengi]
MIESVLGPVSPERLGTVSTNEHVLTDSRGLLRPTREGGTLSGPIRPEILGDLRWSWLSLADNLTLDDEESAVDELSAAARLGLTTIVEATSVGMGPRHRDLPEISRRSGVAIVAAYGSYIDKTLPSWWRDLDEQSIEQMFTAALVDAVPGTGFRAGLLGLLGTSAEITPAERRALDAAARSAAAAGASVSIRLDAAARRGPEVAELLQAQGLPAERILFCNIDKVLDLGYVTDVVDTGAVVEFAFGSEHQFGDGARDATDEQRIDFLFELLGERPDAAVTLSCSVWTKGQLSRHGGMGYGHVVGRVGPSLLRRGLPESALHEMLVTTPARLLDRG